MTMDLVDEMLNRVGDHTPGMEQYSTLRQRLRREYGGINRNRALFYLEHAIEAHLQEADRAILTRIHGEDSPEYELAVITLVDQVDEELFRAGQKVCGNNLISDILLHAAYLKYCGVCETMFDEFKQNLLETAEKM